MQSNYKSKGTFFSFALLVLRTLSVITGLYQLLSISSIKSCLCCVNYRYHNSSNASFWAYPSSSAGSCLFPILFCRYFRPLPIFVSALNAEDEISSIERSKIALIALQSRNRRRKLFTSSLNEHYQKYLEVNKASEKEGYEQATNDFRGEQQRQQQQNQDDCLYYASINVNTMNGDGINDSKSIWATEFCPGRSLSKLKLKRYSNDGDDFSKANSQIVIINSKEYFVEEMINLGYYLDQLKMTSEEYENEIYKIWGIANAGYVEKEDKAAPPPSSFYTEGDECSSVSGIEMRRTSMVRSIQGCCPESSAIKNFFYNSPVDSGVEYTIYNVNELSSCRSIINLCTFCENKYHTKHGSQDDTVINVKEKDNKEQQSVLDLYEHLQDKVKAHIETETAPRVTSNYKSFLVELQNTSPTSFPPMPASKIESNTQLLKSMFQHAYDSYMYNAYPASELQPKSCSPGSFNLVRLPALTLIDTLDTLLLMGNHTEFARSVERLRALHNEMKANPVWANSNEAGGLFAVNQNVSVFETNIRVLGGLLSAHQMAEAWVKNVVLLDDIFDKNGEGIMIGEVRHEDEVVDSGSKAIVEDTKNDHDRNNITPNPDLNTCCEPLSKSFINEQICTILHEPEESNNATSKSLKNGASLEDYWAYDGILLKLARDIGRRLLPAFESKTGIPYGTVNLLHGIPHGETPIASLAGAGSLSLEMELLSRLTGNEAYGKAAKLASRALWIRRSKDKSLLGKHINAESGSWTETLSGIGSNSDSFYEYLLKHYILFPEDKDFFDMFKNTYQGIFKNAR